jgi:hypothetical protein
MAMVDKVIEALKGLNALYPPGGCRHHITYDDAEGVLVLGVWVGGECQSFGLDDSGDMEDAAVLCSRIEELVNDAAPPGG